MKVLVTCPPMLRSIDSFAPVFARYGIEVTAPAIVQLLTEDALVEMLPGFDGWIIGDDPATRRVFEAGVAGRLKAAVKWGAGTDNVDFVACEELGLPIANTPGMFGREVADIALGYVIALARQTFLIDGGVKAGKWPKPVGMSLAGKTVALVGYGDIGRNAAKRFAALEMKVFAYDPIQHSKIQLDGVEFAQWPERINEADFLVFTCALTKENYHMLGDAVSQEIKPGLRIVNVARGPLIDEAALALAIKSGKVHSVALDVFETEPLPADSPLRKFEQRCIFGSHNSSNTTEAVTRTSLKAIELLTGFLRLPIHP